MCSAGRRGPHRRRPAVDHIVSDNASWDNAAYGFTESGNRGRPSLANNTAYRNGGTGFAFLYSQALMRRNLALGNARDANLGEGVDDSRKSGRPCGDSSRQICETHAMADPVQQSVHVEQKWGFGMAPIKPHIQEARTASAKIVQQVIEHPAGLGRSTLDDISTVKGLLNRCHRQDQWDWFTVWQQLGRPGRRAARACAHALTNLRSALNVGNSEAEKEAVAAFRSAGGHVYLASYLSGRTVGRADIGYIYVLSTREQRQILKIGYTDRSVEERVREINRATGVVIPYGVRAVWAVQHAQTVEAELHARLAAYRVRKDREFFNIDFRDAFPIVRDYVLAARQER